MAKITRRDTLAIGGAATLAATLPKPAIAQGAPIKIGFGMALSGGLAAGGKAALLSYQIWQEKVNAEGGLLGRKVELVYYDDQTNPATVPGIYSKLMDIDNVDILLSGYGTNPAAAAMPLIVQRKRLMMSLFALTINEKFKHDRYFQIQPTGPSNQEFSRGFFQMASELNPKPQTVAIAGADAEYPQIANEGVREVCKRHGFKIVYDRFYPPNTIDFLSVVRAIKATNPDILFIASYPPDTAGMIRALHEVGFKAQMVGGGMIGVQFAAFKGQLGQMLNGLITYDVFVPEKTMKFPGADEFLVKYRERAKAAGTDPLGLYLIPFAYAEVQVIEQAIKAVGSLDEGKLAEHMHKAKFNTIVGDVEFDNLGEWKNPRALQVQYQGVVGNDLEQFKQPGKQVILWPLNLRSGNLVVPYDTAKNK
jgi:branched-chain amino acid transport system substrate-binding protein